MTQWMSASAPNSSSTAAAAAAAAAASPLPPPIDIVADSRTHGSSNGHSRSSSVADSLDTNDSIDSSSSLSGGYVAVGSAGVGGVEEEGGESAVDAHSRRGWPELLSASEGHVKRTKSCHAVLVAAAY
jgi:hypothetical protein